MKRKKRSAPFTHTYRSYVRHVERFKREHTGPVLVTVLNKTNGNLEWYDCDKHMGCDVPMVCSLFNVPCTRRNKYDPVITEGNPHMGGFPAATLGKRIAVLLQQGYTIAVLHENGDEDENENDGDAVTEPLVIHKIYSAGTYMPDVDEDGLEEEVSTLRTTALAVHKGVDGAGCAVIDVSTGRCEVWELPFSSSVSAGAGAQDQVLNIVASVYPMEVVMLGTDDDDSFSTNRALVGVDPRCVRDRRASVHPGETVARRRHEHILGKAYSGVGRLESVAESLGLSDLRNARAALCGLLQYVIEHDESIVTNLSFPVVHDSQDSQDMLLGGGKPMRYERDAVQKLGVLSVDEGGLLRCLDACTTPAGKRFLSEALKEPLSDPSAIRARQDAIQAFLDDPSLIATTRTALSGVEVDFEKVFRRMAVGRVHRSARTLKSLLRSLQAVRSLVPPESVTRLIDRLQGVLSFDGNDGDKGHPFNHGIHPDLDDLVRTRESKMRNMMDMKERLQEQGRSGMPGMPGMTGMSGISLRLEKIPREEGCFRIVGETDSVERLVEELVKRGGEGLMMKRRRVVTRSMSTSFSDASSFGSMWPGDVDRETCYTDFDVLPVSASCSMVYHPRISLWNEELVDCIGELEKKATERFGQFIRRLWLDEHEGAMRDVAVVTARTDFLCSCAILARDRRYRKPRIVEGPSSDSPPSYIRATKLRHPVMEEMMLRGGVRHIPNDIDVGQALVFGVNAVGKSCLAKAVALVVVMAQAGMFVPVDECEISPFRSMFVRMQAIDDMTKGRSTFMTEMSDMRAILTRADRNSIVIGDEICAGTESRSSTAVLAASVKRLVTNMVPFFITTHAHSVVNVLAKEGVQVCICHMKTWFQDGLLVYDRTLCEGSGEDTYGLEVCAALNMDDAFVEDAKRMRRQDMHSAV